MFATIKPYLLVLYYSLFLLATLIYIAGFHFLLIGLTFLVALLVKFYAGSKIVIHLVSCYAFNHRAMLNRQQVKINAVVVASLLLTDLYLIAYFPDLVKLNYTQVSCCLFMHIASQCIIARFRKNNVSYANV